MKLGIGARICALVGLIWLGLVPVVNAFPYVGPPQGFSAAYNTAQDTIEISWANYSSSYSDVDCLGLELTVENQTLITQQFFSIDCTSTSFSYPVNLFGQYRLSLSAEAEYILFPEFGENVYHQETSPPSIITLSPAAPALLSAPTESTPGSLSLSWSSVHLASYYDLQMNSTDNENSWEPILSANQLNHSINLISGNYRFRVRACITVNATPACSAWTESSPATKIRFTPQSYNTNDFDTYIGDVNGDGIFDYLLVAKEKFVLIHGDIAIPIL